MSKSLTELMGTSVASFFNNPEVRRRVAKISCQCTKQMGGGGGGLSQVYTTDSESVTWTGTGTQGDPLIATSITSAANLQTVLDAGNTANKGFTLNVGTAPSDGISLMGSASYIFAQTDTNGTSAFLSIGGSTGARLTFGGNTNNSITRTAATDINIYDNTTNIVNKLMVDGRISGTAAVNPNEFVTLSQLSGITLQQATTGGNSSSNELLITGNTLAGTAKGLHIAFDPSANKSSLTNIASAGSTSNTLISMDLHNIEFFTQTGFRLLGLNDQQSGGLALANFNGRVKIEDAFNDNEAMSLGQFKGWMKYGATTFPTDGTTDTFVIPHGLGSNPTYISITFADTTDTNVPVCKRTKDATNITLDYTSSTPPTTGSMTIYWQVIK